MSVFKLCIFIHLYAVKSDSQELLLGIIEHVLGISDTFQKAKHVSLIQNSIYLHHFLLSHLVLYSPIYQSE
jgi:hypothetical protein